MMIFLIGKYNAFDIFSYQQELLGVSSNRCVTFSIVGF